MPNGDVFGGSSWFAQQLQAAIQQAMLEFQRQQATGYIQPREAQPGPGRDEALQAIYAHRYDIGKFYDETWGEDKGTPLQRMENWVGITTEEVGDPITFAADQGWIELPEAAAGNGDGEAAPTLERERYESDLDRWEDEFARTERLDVQTLQQWEDTFRYQKARDAEADREWGLEFLRAQGLDQAAQDRWEAEQFRLSALDKDARNQWELEFARAEGLDEQAFGQWQDEHDLRVQAAKDARTQWQSEFLRLQGLDEQAQDRWTAEFEAKSDASDEDTRRWNEEFMRAQGLDDEAIRQFNIQQGRLSTLDAETKRQWNAEFARAQGLDTESIRQWGMEQSLREREFNLTEQQVATAAQQWESEFGLTREESERASQQWSAEFERGGAEWEREQAWEEEYGRGQLGMDFMTLMSTLRGPRNLRQYENVMRAAQGTQFPAWAANLAQGLGFAPYQGAVGPMQGMGMEQFAQGQQPYGGAQPAGIPLTPEALAQQQQAAGAPPEGIVLGQQQQGTQPYPVWGEAFMQQLARSPQLVRPDQWANMTPFERNRLMGEVEYAGADWDSWLQMMQKAGPTGGQVQGTSFFGGGW